MKKMVAVLLLGAGLSLSGCGVIPAVQPKVKTELDQACNQFLADTRTHMSTVTLGTGEPLPPDKYVTTADNHSVRCHVYYNFYSSDYNGVHSVSINNIAVQADYRY